MDKLPTLFNYEGKELRIVVKDGEPWFVASDVCDVPGKAKNDWLGYVYVIEYGEGVKIGHSTNLQARYKQITSNAKNYADVAVGRIAFAIAHTNHKENESILHKHFAEKRHGKSELFTLTLEEFLENVPVLQFKDDSEDKRQNADKFLNSMKGFILGGNQ